MALTYREHLVLPLVPVLLLASPAFAQEAAQPTPALQQPTSGVDNAASAPGASADQATPPPSASQTGDTPGEIAVTGIRRSLERAADIKRAATQVVDSVVAQEIGKLPNLTTAAALQVVPGIQVSVNRNDELADVRVRGLPDISARPPTLASARPSFAIACSSACVPRRRS